MLGNLGRLVRRERYNDIAAAVLSYKLGRAKDLPSIDELFPLPSGQTDHTAFDDKTDTALEALARKRLEEMRGEVGK